jgi:hypothetical protein
MALVARSLRVVLLTAGLLFIVLPVLAYGPGNLPPIGEIHQISSPIVKKHVDHTPRPGLPDGSGQLAIPLADGVYDTLYYDDGEPLSAYRWAPGYRMATRLTPDTTETECKILAIQFYHWTPGAFRPGIFDWSGSSPSDTLLEWDATSTVAGFNTFMVDTANIVVSGDFIVSHECVDTITSLGFDSYNNGRAWEYYPNPPASWHSWIETYFIRAIVEYPPYESAPPRIDILTPTKVILEPPYPNPFNPTTTFTIHRNLSGPMSLKIYNLLGQEVATLVNGYAPVGTIKVVWDADKNPSGIYWAVLQDQKARAIQKIVLLK